MRQSAVCSEIQYAIASKRTPGYTPDRIKELDGLAVKLRDKFKPFLEAAK